MKNILLCWGYHRKGWVSPFLEMDKTGIQFHYLFYFYPEDEPHSFVDDPKHYWGDFKNAQHLLDTIQPDKIVFMSIDAPNSMALNRVAQKRGIKTYVFQHGLFHTLDFYINIQLDEQKMRAEQPTHNIVDPEAEAKNKRLRQSILSFFLRSLRPSDLGFFAFALQHQLDKRKMIEQLALKKNPSKYRRPTNYIVFTKYNANIYHERDGAPKDTMIEIGYPEMDQFFRDMHANHQEPDEPYYLHIDQALSGVKEFNSPGLGISMDEMNAFFLKLNEYALSKNVKLKIKLHPYGYDNDDYVMHPNIEYIKDCDIVSLIQGSKGVFGFMSSLLLPSIILKPCCLFKIWDSTKLVEDGEALGIIQHLPFRGFQTSDIDFDSINRSDSSIATFVSQYLYKNDGKAVERLRQVLTA